jgi:membrane associated rhomboid family serine protease
VTTIRILGHQVELGDEEWEIWLRQGRVPPNALVLGEDGRWVRADSLEIYWRLAPRRAASAGDAASGLRDVLFPKRGLSVTEALLALNLLVFLALAMAWGSDYMGILRGTTASWWRDVHEGHAYGWWLSTLFMHAGPGHLVRNLIALVAASGAVEFLAGRRWTVIAYLVTGIGGAWVSYAGRAAPPLSVGASGAIFGLLGCTLAFIIRRRRLFNYAQQWKVWRIYVPLFVLLFLPAIVNADVRAHAGGCATGFLLGFWIPPHPRIGALAAADPLRDEEDDETSGPVPD